MPAPPREPEPDAVTLFSVPYAGGNSWAYRLLESHLPAGVALEALELPGRGRRSAEPLCSSLDELADDLFRQLSPRIGSGRYAFFGHSMGALLAFLVTLRIRQAGLPLPDALFLSGSEAPSALTKRERHLLSKPDFLEMLRGMGGCPPAVLQDAELLAFFEPILRADFKAVETWQGSDDEPLDVPLLVMIGRDDDVSEDRARPWARATTRSMRLHAFDGNHFFILQHWARIGSMIHAELMGVAAGPARVDLGYEESQLDS
jgi:surfactin synthase thioesterase subunit